MINTEYKYYNIKIKNQLNYEDTLEENPNRFKTYKLLFQIRQYERLTNQDKDYVTRLRESGIKVITKKRKVNNEIQLEYFKEYAIINKDSKYRQKLIDIIMKKGIFETGNGAYDNAGFIRHQNEQNVEKQSKDELMDEYLIILDTISSYLMCDNRLASCMSKSYDREDSLDKQMEKTKKIQTKRLYSPTPKQTHEQYKEWKSKNKFQAKKWHKTKTYKLSNIYSYTYDKDIKVWDWFKEDWIEYKSPLNTYVKRLIDPNKPKVVKWCLVDTENVFEFNNKKFTISNNIKNYQVRNKVVYSDGKLNNFTNECDMEQVLSFYIPHEDKYYFFDENINRIDNINIIEQ